LFIHKNIVYQQNSYCQLILDIQNTFGTIKIGCKFRHITKTEFVAGLFVFIEKVEGLDSIRYALNAGKDTARRGGEPSRSGIESQAASFSALEL
jgi:hypothetical protein